MLTSVQNEKDFVTVSLSGHIDEGIGIGLERIFPSLEGKSVVFNLKEVKTTNSIGISLWISMFMESLKAKDYCFENVPENVLYAASLVPNIFYGGSIKSFLYDYNCAKCDFSERRHFTILGIAEKGGLPTISCPSCSEEIDPGDDADEISQFWTEDS